VRHRTGFVLCSCLVGCLLASSGSSSPVADDPIAFTGHGAMFDSQGRQIAVTQEFLEQAQGLYLYALDHLADGALRSRIDAERARLLQGRDWDPQSRMIANSAIIDRLLDELDPLDKLSDLRGKNRLIEQYLRSGLPLAAHTPTSPLPASLGRVLDSWKPAARPAGATSTNAERLQYIADCKACGVPIPPDWGDPKWVNKGQQTKVFISVGQYAEVYIYQSTDPEGVCYALPRRTTADDSGDIGLLGIICLGKQSSRACFWDNQSGGRSFIVGKNQSVALTQFEGGPGLKEGESSGPGRCSSCHSGENPFIIHPSTALATAVPSDERFGNDWYKPMVHPSWPQNEGPTDILDATAPNDSTPAGPDQGCLNCHVKGDAGRFPMISAHISEYCSAVLGGAIGSTMKTYANRYPNHASKLQDQCSLQIPIPNFTVNSTNPTGCGFGFTFCPQPANVTADGTISTTYSGGPTKFVWGICETTGLDQPCVCSCGFDESADLDTPGTRDFGNLAPGTYRIRLRTKSGPMDLTRSWDVSIPTPDQCSATATDLALVSAEFRDGAVALSWAGPAAFVATLQRQKDGGGWSDLAGLTSTGDGRLSFADADVVPGGHYDYRLALDRDGTRVFVGEAHVAIPMAAGFTVGVPRPTPSNGAVRVGFSLPAAGSVRLEVLDAAGRVLSRRELPALAPGWHDVEASEARRLPGGIYFLRVTRLGTSDGGDARTARLLIVR